MRDSNRLITAAACFGALGVILGAFGAHALEARLSAGALVTFETGVRYQLWHALAMLATGVLATQGVDLRRGRLQLAGWAFALGIVLFSGSLYAIVFTGIRALGIVTPFGGLCFVAGWLSLALAARRPGRSDVHG